MARLILMIVLLDASALANDSSTKPEESEFRQEMLQTLNKTNEKLDRLMRIVFNQPVEMRRFVEEKKLELMKFANATNDKLDQLAKTVDQRFDQVLEKQREIEENGKSDREKMDALANITQPSIRHNPKCNSARSSNLTLLSNGKKYFFSYPTKASWPSAYETCSKKGLHFTTIKDQNDARVVAQETQKIYSSTAWWVSAKNRGRWASRKDFRWLDGTKLELDSPLWKDGARKTDDCIATNNLAQGKLYSVTCTFSQPFICELPSECY